MAGHKHLASPLRLVGGLKKEQGVLVQRSRVDKFDYNRITDNIDRFRITASKKAFIYLPFLVHSFSEYC
jgi:hypothetical protein